jgi:hypothetical protein
MRSDNRLLRSGYPGIAACVLCFLFACILMAPEISAENDYVARRLSLSAKLDSIELMKQARRRKGESIQDLEAATAAIRDSIAALRSQMAPESGPSERDQPAQKASAQPARPSGQEKSAATSFPSSTFDWVILIVGGVAVLSGIVLIIGLLQAWKNKSSQGRKRADIYKEPAQRPAPAMPEKIAREMPASAEPRQYNVDSRIDALRRKIREDAARGPEDAGISLPLPAAPKAEEKASDEVKNLVMEGARQGMSVQELSRKYHVGTDQVALILRMTRQTPRIKE